MPQQGPAGQQVLEDLSQDHEPACNYCGPDLIVSPSLRWRVSMPFSPGHRLPSPRDRVSRESIGLTADRLRRAADSGAKEENLLQIKLEDSKPALQEDTPGRIDLFERSDAQCPVRCAGTGLQVAARRGRVRAQWCGALSP